MKAKLYFRVRTERRKGHAIGQDISIISQPEHLEEVGLMAESDDPDTRIVAFEDYPAFLEAISESTAELLSSYQAMWEKADSQHTLVG